MAHFDRNDIREAWNLYLLNMTHEGARYFSERKRERYILRHYAPKAVSVADLTKNAREIYDYLCSAHEGTP